MYAMARRTVIKAKAAIATAMSAFALAPSFAWCVPCADCVVLVDLLCALNDAESPSFAMAWLEDRASELDTVSTARDDCDGCDDLRRCSPSHDNVNATIIFPSHANGQFGIRAATVGIAIGITSGDNDIAVEVTKVSAVAEPVAAIIAACDRVDMIAAELLEADAGFGIDAGIGCPECIHSIFVPAVELVVNATIDVGTGNDVGVDARIGCPECIHSISPSRNVVRSWRPKNAAVWKSKRNVLGIYPTINWLRHDATIIC